MLGDLPASATFPHQRDARKGRICATRFLFATTICCVLVLRRKLLSAQACASPSASRCKCYIGVGWIRLEAGGCFVAAQADVGRQSAAVRQEGGIYALYLADRRASAKVHAFTEFLAKRFGSPPYWDRT